MDYCSMLFVALDKEYLGYVDFRTRAFRFCLMSVMARLQKSGMFQCVAQVLLSTVGRAWQLMVPVVILQTVAVNLASTLTPIGNL